VLPFALNSVPCAITTGKPTALAATSGSAAACASADSRASCTQATCKQVSHLAPRFIRCTLSRKLFGAHHGVINATQSSVTASKLFPVRTEAAGGSAPVENPWSATGTRHWEACITRCTQVGSAPAEHSLVYHGVGAGHNTLHTNGNRQPQPGLCTRIPINVCKSSAPSHSELHQHFSRLPQNLGSLHCRSQDFALFGRLPKDLLKNPLRLLSTPQEQQMHSLFPQ